MDDEDEGSPTGDLEEDDLYMICCDLSDTVRTWLADGTGLHLDDLLMSITAIERLDDILDMDLIEQYGPLVSSEPTVRSVFDTAGDILHEHLSRRHLDEAGLRRLRDELRSTMNELQKAIGGLESRTADIDDLQQRIAMRKQIHAVSDLQKRVRALANTLSALHELRWESSFSGVRIQITPKPGTVCRPLQSAILQVEIPGPAGLEAVVEGQSVAVSVEGTMRLSVSGRPDIPDVDVAKAVVDQTGGVTVAGDNVEIQLAKKGTKTKVQVRETS